MIEAALIQQCADPGLKPAIVEQFIERAGSADPLAVSVRSGNRVVLVPKATTPEQAMDLIRQHVGHNTVRVGITQYPAGLGVMEAGELKPDLVNACENLRMGTALFAKVYRIVTRWYGNPTAANVMPQVFDDAVIAWQSGYFEGTAVFRAEDPGQAELGAMRTGGSGHQGEDETAPAGPTEPLADPVTEQERDDPNKAGIRVDLSGIGARRP